MRHVTIEESHNPLHPNISSTLKVIPESIGSHDWDRDADTTASPGCVYGVLIAGSEPLVGYLYCYGCWCPVRSADADESEAAREFAA
jgi:hypothetical protein